MIAVGPGAPNKDGNVVPTQVKAGDRVLLPGWGGNSIKVGDEVGFFSFSFGCAVPNERINDFQEFQLFKDSEILAKIQE